MVIKQALEDGIVQQEGDCAQTGTSTSYITHNVLSGSVRLYLVQLPQLFSFDAVTLKLCMQIVCWK